MDSDIQNDEATAPPGHASGEPLREREGGRVGEHNKYRMDWAGEHPVMCAP